MEPELLLLADGPQLLQVVEGACAGGAEGDAQEEGDEAGLPAGGLQGGAGHLSVLMASRSLSPLRLRFSSDSMYLSLTNPMSPAFSTEECAWHSTH